MCHNLWHILVRTPRRTPLRCLPFLAQSRQDQIRGQVSATEPHRPDMIKVRIEARLQVIKRGLREHGLSIPDDIAVVGFDNQEVIAAHLRPPLSTVSLPHYELGAAGVRMLLGLEEAQATAPIKIHCPTVERNSVGALAPRLANPAHRQKPISACVRRFLSVLPCPAGAWRARSPEPLGPRPRRVKLLDVQRIDRDDVPVPAVPGRRCGAQVAAEAGVVLQLNGAGRELGAGLGSRALRQRGDVRRDVEHGPVPEPAGARVRRGRRP